MWHALQKGGRPGKSYPPPGLRAAMTRQDRFLWSTRAAPSRDHKEPGSLQFHCANVPKPCLAGELLPGFPRHYCDGHPRLRGRKHCLPIALQAPENPGTASRNHFIFSFLLLSTAAAQAPVSIYLLSPVGQTLRQVLDATMLILLLPGTLHRGCYSHTERETVPRSKPHS